MTSHLILGINGQDGILLSRLLDTQNKSVVGIGTQRDVSVNVPRRVTYFSGNICDTSRLIEIIKNNEIGFIYNLAGISSVAQSFRDPQATLEINYQSVHSLLKALYSDLSNSHIKFFQSSSSEMFGSTRNGLQDEGSTLNPQSPYAEAKVKAHLECHRFRNEGFFVSCGILFNHESIFRPETFVSRKVTSSVARIKLGKQNRLHMGNLDSQRDWGSASDYVEAINAILEHGKADDFVVATGKSHSVRDLVNFALKAVGLEDRFEEFVTVDESFIRKNDLQSTIGNASKIQRVIGWKARTSFEELIKEMVNFDLRINSSGNPKNH